MEPTDTSKPDYFHRVVDCQWACRAHADVPESIRLTAKGEFTAAYMVNRESNVFPGILGRVCDRPCEPACRRGRIEEKPVAICRLKRVASDNRDDITALLPKVPREKNGKRIACIGAGPASLTVANDLLPLGYDITIFEQYGVPRGLMRTNIPAFRLPAKVLDEEIGYIVDMGADLRLNSPIKSMKRLLHAEEFEPVFVGAGAPKGKELELPGRHDNGRLHIGQENALPWIEKGIGIELDKWNVPKVNAITFQSTLSGVFFGGDAAFGPKNIIWSVEHGHQAAISIHKFCHEEPIDERLARGVTLSSRKMGMHEWAYKNEYNGVERRLVPHVGLVDRFKKINIEVEMGFTAEEAALEVQRCLNCDVQTVFSAKLCIECDACIDICPVDCLTIVQNCPEADLRARLTAPATNPTQALYVSAALPQTARVMVKDEDVCVNCGLCAGRCPTAAWDMQKSTIRIPLAIDEEVRACPA